MKKKENQFTDLFKWLCLSTIVTFFDQLSKVFILNYYGYAQFQRITNFLNLILIYNPGAAFGFLSNAGGWQRWLFTISGLIAIFFIFLVLYKNLTHYVYCFALSLILGGAVGNIIDRIFYGYVIDFIDFHWMRFHWPTFNLADGAISIGVLLLFIDDFRSKR